MPGQPPVIRVESIEKAYGRSRALRKVSIEVRSGEIYGLIGPDGSGKSTLMKVLAGVLTFDAGEVQVFGTALDTERAAERIKGRIGFMPQGLGLNLYPELSVEENIDFFARLRLLPEKELAERKEELLAMTRLKPFRGRPMKNLSGGMKQKLGLVCTLIHEPELVILDEPTTGVDPVSRRDFWAILARILRDRGITALVSTAYMDEAARFQRSSLFYEGEVLAEGATAEMTRLVPGTQVNIRPTGRPLEALSRLRRSFSQVEAIGPWFKVFVDQEEHREAEERVLQALDGLEIEEVYSSDPELEDVFIALLNRREKGLPAAGEETPSAPSSAAGREAAGNAIEARELVRDFGAFRAVDRVSFTVAQGEVFGLLGANGAGKTTVIKMLTGILPPTAGEGLVAGADMRRAGRTIKERIGYMSQAFSLYQDLTVIENIRLYAGIYGLGRSLARERAAWILNLAGLEGREHDQAGRLPMGLRQRLALGCALVHRPRILFLDEPTSGVDPVGRRRFWDVLFKLSREDRVTILVTTHYMSEAEHCDHLALMYAGRIVADAGPAEMKQSVEAEAGKLIEVLTPKPLTAMGLLEEAGFEGVALFGNAIHLLSPDPADSETRIRDALDAGGVALQRIETRPLSMEDVFVHRVLSLEREERRTP